MYHSITIGDKNTWDDWKMIPSSRPVVAPPVEKVISVDVPGRDGTTYLSNSLTGYPVFKSRDGTWEFYLDTDALRGNNLSSPIGAGALDHLSRMLHKGNATPGQVRVRLEDDPAFFYLGRVWVDGGIKQQNGHSLITLGYTLYPFKFLYESIREDWLWDDFGFETDLALPYCKDLSIKAGETLKFPMPPSEKPSLIQVERSGASGGTLTATLRKSRSWPYDEAKRLGLKNTATSVSLTNNTKADLGIVDNDLRYDVYEVVLTATTAMTVGLYYQPAYL